jgi:cobalt-zinc-cadmium efflux system membrane fusion protein
MNSFFPTPLRAAAAALALCAAFGLAHAGEGHDHGDTATAAAGAASPRLGAHSDLFELVGIVEGGRMTIYLDRYASNEPVTGAKVEFESGAAKGIAAPQPDGTYLIQMDALGKPGEMPFSFTVTAGADTDLLAGELHIADPHDHHGEAAARPWLRWAGWAAALIAAIAATALLARRLTASRRARLVA